MSVNGVDFRGMSREELFSEIEKRDELIANLKAELQKYRNQDFTTARKIAVSAETASYGDRKVIQKDQHTWDIIESAFLTNDFLCQLEKQQMDEMIESMHQLDVPADSMIIRQGEHGSLLYVLEDGKLQVTKDNRLLRIMDAPCVFGELAILYHCERTASVKALTPCRLWAIERPIFHTIMVNSAKTKHDSLFKFLKRCRRFVQLPDERLHTLADLAKEEHWPFRTEITPNQITGKVLVVTQGRLVLRRNSPSATPELHTLVPGDVFGEIDELFSVVHNPNPGAYPLYSTNFRQPPRGERYFVDSVDGCTLLAMLVEQICRKFQSTALIDDSAVQPSKRARSIDRSCDGTGSKSTVGFRQLENSILQTRQSINFFTNLPMHLPLCGVVEP